MGSKNNKIGGEHVIDLISAYIDNALDAADRERVRAHIATCELCGAEHRELQATQQMLRALPVQVPPRVFMLTEEMVGARAESGARPWLLARLFGRAAAPRLATGSVLAFVLLLVVLVSDLGVLSLGANAGMTAAPLAGIGTEGGSQEQRSVSMAQPAPTVTTTAWAAMDALADQPTAEAAMPATGGGGTVSETPSVGEGAYGAPPQPTAAMSAEATATTSTGGLGDRQLEYAATAEAAAANQATASQADGTPSPALGQANNFFLVPPTEAAEAGKRAPVAGADDGSRSTFPVTLALEIGLAVLAVGLAIGAVLAGRKGA